MSTAQLEMRNVTKDFDGQRALDGVDLTVCKGEVHALLGANGSGKSTLIKVLAGVHRPAPGSTVAVRGRLVEQGSSHAAHAAGVRFIHQDLGLVDELDVAENLALGASSTRALWLSDRTEWRRAKEVLRKHSIDLDPRRLVASLRPAEKSMVAIVRAVEDGLGDGGVLVLDEPTAALPPHEVRHLMDLIHRLRDDGVSILYVTHRLHEVFEIADTVTVLRDGRRVATEPIEEVHDGRLLEMILGRRLEAYQPSGSRAAGEPVLDVEGLSGESIQDVSFTVGAGEVVGVAGLIGSGHESVLETVFGAAPPSRGTVRVDGRRLRRPSPRNCLAAGVVYAPAERRTRGAMLDWTLRENLTLPSLPSGGIAGRISRRAESAEAGDWLRRLGVKPGDPEARFGSLSGGNQQKVVIGRWLRCSPRVFLLAEPTIGVDAGAKRAIYEELRGAAQAGAGVVIASSDAEELATVCDRVLVFDDGRVVDQLQAPLRPDDVVAACMRSASNGALRGKHADTSPTERHDR